MKELRGFVPSRSVLMFEHCDPVACEKGKGGMTLTVAIICDLNIAIG